MFGTVRRIVRFWRVVQVLQVTGGMDSDTENDMVERFRESDIGLKGDKGPKYDGKQTSWAAGTT